MSEANMDCPMCNDDEDYPDCECVSYKQLVAQLEYDAEQRIERNKELEEARGLVNELRERRFTEQQARIAALEGALRRIADHHKSTLPDGSHNPDWAWDHVKVSEFAARALLSPAPADGTT